MPGMDGVTATKRIRALPGPASRVPIIAMTANVLPRQIETFRNAGMNGHVGKPFRREDLLAAVARHVRQAVDPKPASETITPAPAVLDADVFAGAVALLGDDKMNSFLGKLKARLQGRFATEPENSEERKRLASEAHALVSSTGILGFTALSRRCAQLEAACNDDGQQLTALLDEVRQACHAALAEIDARLVRADTLSKAV
jgi:HPt (histidine-containing phosphotransfer) domain-containing protein